MENVFVASRVGGFLFMGEFIAPMIVSEQPFTRLYPSAHRR
jgi:hypothetical protein